MYDKRWKDEWIPIAFSIFLTNYISIMKVNNERDLANAIKNNQDEIIIEGDLSKKVIRIVTTGKVSWVIAIGAVSVAVIVALKTPVIAAGGAPALAMEGIIATTSAGAAVSIWGITTTIAAISICVAGGSISILKKLYGGYKIVSKRDGYVKLKKK